MIKIIDAPSFSRVKYDFSGVSFWNKVKFVLNNPPRLILTEDMRIELTNGTVIVIPKGFITDGASVPRWFWAIPGFSPFGPLLEGGIPHDFFYQYGYFLTEYDEDIKYSATEISIRNQYGLHVHYFHEDQEFGDKVLYETVKFSNGSSIISTITYKVLRLFGHYAWDDYRVYGPSIYYENSLQIPGRSSTYGVIF